MYVLFLNINSFCLNNHTQTHSFTAVAVSFITRLVIALCGHSSGHFHHHLPQPPLSQHLAGQEDQ